MLLPSSPSFPLSFLLVRVVMVDVMVVIIRLFWCWSFYIVWLRWGSLNLL